MKKLVYMLMALMSILVMLGLWCSYMKVHCYEKIELHSRLKKVIVVDTRGSDCYRTFGTYKIIYKRYNHPSIDSTYYSYSKDSILVEYWVDDSFDTVCIKYTDLAKRR